MANIVRKANWEDKKRAIEHGNIFYMDEIVDVLQLIATKQWPDAKFSDNECCLWEAIRRELKINYD